MKGLRALMAAEPQPAEPATPQELQEHGIIDFPVQPTRQDAPQRLAARQSHLPETHRALPNSMDAEKGVLGSILIAAQRGPEMARKLMFWIEQKLGVSHFYFPAHAEIYKAIKQLHMDNEPLDLITLTNQLEHDGILDHVGGVSLVTDLFTFTPTDANVTHYVDILQEKHALRQIAQLGEKLSGLANLNGQSDPAQILEDAALTLKAIQTSKRIGELPDLDDMSTLTGENLPKPPAELVKGILHRGSKMIIGGTSKGRKTFSLIDLAISVSTGTDFWGCPTIKGKVCYINFEIQRPFFAKRFEDICRKKCVKVDPGQFMCWTLRGLSEGLEKMSANLIKVLLQEDYVLIVFDPIYKALGDRDENKAGDVASMLNELEAIAVKTGAAIAFGAHYSKGNQASKDAMDRIGGSGVFARDPDAILTMTPHEEEECFTVDATLRNFPPQKPFVVRWDWPLFDRDELMDPESLKKPKNIRAVNTAGQFGTEYTLDMVLDALKTADEDKPTPSGRSATELQLMLKGSTGMSSATFWRIWNKEGKKSPFLVLKDRRWFHISSLTR
jgi:hypothetical protein